MKRLLKSCLVAVGLVLTCPAQSAMRCPGPDCPAGRPDDDRAAKESNLPKHPKDEAKAKPRPEKSERERQQIERLQEKAR